MPENQEAFELYQIVQSQYIVGFGGPVDINMSTVIDVMRLYRIEDKQAVFDKVVRAARAAIQAMHDRDDD